MNTEQKRLTSTGIEFRISELTMEPRLEVSQPTLSHIQPGGTPMLESHT